MGKNMIRSFSRFDKKADLIHFDPKLTVDTVCDKEGNPEFGFIIDDFEFAKEYAKEHPELYPYTIIEEEGCYIVSGWHFVNRLGYLFGKNKVENVGVPF